MKLCYQVLFTLWTSGLSKSNKLDSQNWKHLNFAATLEYVNPNPSLSYFPFYKLGKIFTMPVSYQSNQSVSYIEAKHSGEPHHHCEHYLEDEEL